MKYANRFLDVFKTRLSNERKCVFATQTMDGIDMDLLRDCISIHEEEYYLCCSLYLFLIIFTLDIPSDFMREKSSPSIDVTLIMPKT